MREHLPTSVPVSKTDYSVRLIGGIKTRLAFSEWRTGNFSGADHVAVHYLLPTSSPTGRNMSRFGWLPVEMWEGGQVIGNMRTNMEVWS